MTEDKIIYGADDHRLPGDYVGRRVRIVHPDNNEDISEEEYYSYEGDFTPMEEHENKEGICVKFAKPDIFEVVLDEAPDDYIEAYFQEMELIGEDD